MLLIGLLLVALVCLTLGIVLASGVWLIASLAVTVLAGLVLFALRSRIGKKPGTGRPATELESAPVAAPSAQAAASSSSFAEVLAAAPTAAVPVLDEPAPDRGQEPEVWVVDGEPQYHLKRCPALTAAAEPVPHSQAVEDGFTACTVCNPEAELAGVAEVEPAAPAFAPGIAADAEIWVVDGSPDFHLAGCALLGPDAEQVPYAQAIEDGFTACGVCQPKAALVAATAPTTAEPAEDEPAEDEPVFVAVSSSGGGADGSLTEVWVMDAQPDYHLVLCQLLDESAEAVPYEQAIEDGFTACELCDPEASTAFVPFQPATVATLTAVPQAEPEPITDSGEIAIELVPQGSLGGELPALAPAAAEGDVWVEDARPYYHGTGCALLGTDAEPLPLADAVEEGFEPCALCQEINLNTSVSHPDLEPEPEPEPESTPASAPESEPKPMPVSAPEPERESVVEPAVAPVSVPVVPTSPPVAVEGDVWVVDGRPRYHRVDCLLVRGQSAVPIPHDQAVEDGFLPCSLCEPDR